MGHSSNKPGRFFSLKPFIPDSKRKKKKKRKKKTTQTKSLKYKHSVCFISDRRPPKPLIPGNVQMRKETIAEMKKQ